MGFLRYFLVGLMLVSMVIATDEDSDDEGVMISSEEEFKELTDKKAAFVMFFAPWCGHCQRLKPAWGQLSSDINSDETIPITIAKVDCTKSTKLCSNEGVMGYPTLKLYKVGEEAERHKGGRDVESLKKFVMDNIKEAEEVPTQTDEGSHVEGLFDLSKDNFHAHVKKGFHFVKFYAPWCGHCRKLEPTWMELAKQYIPKTGVKNKVTIARVDCTEHRSICTELQVRGYPTLLMLKDGKIAEDYMSSRELKALQTFVEKTIKGEDDDDELDENEEDNKEITIHDENGLFDLKKDVFHAHIAKGVHFIKFYAPWCGHCRRLEPTWKELAGLYVPNKDDGDGKVKIGRIDCTENSDVCSEFKVRGYPTLLIIKDAGEVVDKYQGARDLEALKKFVKKHTGEEEAEPEVEEEQEDEVNDGLYDLTSNNFQTHISKGVHFIKFYAPWCGHCKRLEPTWTDLAKSYKDDDSVKIARIDCTANSAECQKFEVRGYPTLLLIKDGKKIEKYKSGRDLESFKKYLKEKLSQPTLEAPEADGKQYGVPVKGLYDLNTIIFDAHIKQGLHFVKFYAPWCGHCRRLEPTWVELAKLYEPSNSDESNKITIARVDCTSNQEVCTKYEVRGYPTLLLFKDGEKVDKYQGSRELDKLDGYLKTKSGKEVDEMEAILKQDTKQPPVADDDAKGVLHLHATNFEYHTATDATFVMFYAPWCGFCKKMKPTWLDLSKEEFNTDIPVQIANVDCTKNTELCSEYKVSGFPTMLLFVEGQPRPKYTGGRSKEELFNYVVDELKKKPQVEQVQQQEEEEEKPQLKDEL